jgi:hypothetical protein
MYDRIWKQHCQTVIHPWVMQTQVQDIPKFTHNNDAKHSDIYIFEGDVNIASSICNMNKTFNVAAWACIAHIPGNIITDKYPKAKITIE